MDNLNIEYINKILFDKVNIEYNDNKYIEYLNIFSTIILPEILKNGVTNSETIHVKNFIKNNILFSELINFDEIEYINKKSFCEIINHKYINYSIYISMQAHATCLVFDLSFKDRIIFRILNTGFNSKLHTSLSQIECNCAIEYILFINNMENIDNYISKIFGLFKRFISINFKEYNNLYQLFTIFCYCLDNND